MSLKIKELLATHAGVESLGGTVVMPVEEQAELANEVEHQKMRVEIKENSKEIDKIAETVEDIEDEVEELEEVVEGLEALAAMPELNRPTINVLYRRAQKINDRLGGADQTNVAGNESLETDDAYRAAVISGCEAFSDTLKKMYIASSSFIKNLYYALVDGITRLFGYVRDVAKKAEKVKAEVKGKEIKTKIKLGGWNRFFGGNLNGPDRVMSDIAAVLPSFGALIKKMCEIDKASADGNKAILQDIGSLASKFESAAKNSTTFVKIVGDPMMHKNPRATSSKALITFAAPDVAKTTDLDKAMAQFHFNLTPMNEWNVAESNPLTGEHAAMISQSQVDTVLNDVVKDSETIKKVKADVDGLKSTVDGVISKLKSGPKEGKDEEATKALIKALKRAMGKYSQLTNNYCRILSSIADAKVSAVKAHF